MSPTQYYNELPDIYMWVTDESGSDYRATVPARTALALKLASHIAIANGGTVTVSALARALHVSWATARKEVKILEGLDYMVKIMGNYHVAINGYNEAMNNGELIDMYNQFVRDLYL